MKDLKTVFLMLCLLCGGCQTITVPDTFEYREIQTSHFKLAAYQKITNPEGVYKVYIEGDGHAFNRRGMPTNNPTPQNGFWRQAAFNDSSDNVIYLGRPCQYVADEACTQTDWTTGRFSKEVIQSTNEAVEQLTNGRPIIFIGFSGGAQVAGLVSVTHNKLPVKKLITVAGNLDHSSWTAQENLQPLSLSMDLKNYRESFLKIPQIHYVGGKDTVVPLSITQNFIKDAAPVIVVPGASHQTGWDDILPAIWAEE